MNDKKITVLYVHANNTDIGGADYCLFKLASELDRKRFRPIICLSKKTDIFDLYRKAGIKTYLVNMERIKKNKNPLFLLKLLVKIIPTVMCLRKIIKKEGVDIVHGNDLLDIYGPMAGKLANVPVTQYVRWIIVSPVWMKKIITCIVLIINDMIITVSNGVAKEMFSKDGAVLPNITTCYDWIDMDKVGHSEKGADIRMEYDIPPDVPVVGCVGRLEYWKGQDVFIKAAAEVLSHFPETRFLVVGGGVEGRGREAYAVQLKALARELNIEDKVIFAGHRSDISDVMKSFDIFVHSSITPDPLPGVVMEAMYCSRPVVGADAGGVPEEVAEDITGLLYPPGNHRQMADKIIYLLGRPKVARQMGERGKKRVKKIFDKNILCARMEDIYKNLVKGRIQYIHSQ